MCPVYARVETKYVNVKATIVLKGFKHKAMLPVRIPPNLTLLRDHFPPPIQRWL
jgi:hypothetical protein